MSTIEQGSEAWKQLRCGKVTASRVADVVAKTKTGVSAMRGNYMAELLVERLTGLPTEGYVSAEMKWGTENEPDARAAYEFHADVEVALAAFVPHPSITMAGASPDGYIGDLGLVEIKCPNTSTHIETLLGQAVPAKYLTQMQWQMACTGRQWCDFVSFDPRMPESMRLFIRRIPRDQSRIDELQTDVVNFLMELDNKTEALRSLYEQEKAA